MDSDRSTVLIIGAGPAGLATAGRLGKQGIQFRIVEKSTNVGDKWRSHYDRLHLHSVKRLSHLPHLRFPEEYPVYVPRQAFVDYLENYAQHFEIQPEYGVTVTGITKDLDKHWKVQTDQGEIKAEHVVVATGVNAEPVRPNWAGLDSFDGDVVHSADYKNPAPFLNSRTLVIGMGNTGAEIALDLCEKGVDTFLSVRSPVNIVPRDLNGRPVQETALILDKIPFGLGEWLGARIQNVYFGNLKKYGLEKSKVKPAIQLMETGKTPVIDIGTVAAIKAGKISVVPDVQSFDKNSVTLASGSKLDVDHVILATGYKSTLDLLIDNMHEWLDPLGYPKGAVGQGYHTGLYFVGFNNYELGGILGTIYKDSDEVVKSLASYFPTEAVTE